MLELKGKYNQAVVYTDNIDETALSQITELLNQEFCKGSIIRIMPDCHAGIGCTIGTTMTIKDKIVPNLVGVDIGCGMLTVELGDIDLDFKRIDDYIRKHIPSGFKINREPKANFRDSIEKLICFSELSKSSKEFNKALGSLGGGNHFIEINVDKNNSKYLVIHSGSRNLGHQVASYYQKRAYDYHNGLKHKKDGKLPKDLCYLEGKLMDEYLHDMKIAQEYASLNRKIIARGILEECMQIAFDSAVKFETIHNYIDLDSMILRKGAISARDGEKLLIPINMRDGSIIAIGKGNQEWNYSAPHGAGRLMSRTEAKERISFDEFKNSMSEIYTTTVKKSTLDEAPMAYKPIKEIVNNVKDTVEIIDIIRPLYNYKA